MTRPTKLAAEENRIPPDPTRPEALRLKAIPPARDRLQSRLLVWIVTPLISLACVQLIHWTIVEGHSWEVNLAKALTLSITFALLAWALRAATPGAALIGGMICLLLTCYTGSLIKSPLHSAIPPLLTLFLLTLLATRAGRRQKIERGVAENRKGRRASQVIANLGMAALLSSSGGYTMIRWADQRSTSPSFDSYWIFCIVILAVLAEATADTVSSEIGQAFGGQPILLTTFRRAETGVDGAISLTGTFAGILAAAIVAGVGMWSMHLHADQVCIAFTAATLGLFFDSLLGATIERRGYLGNDLVNFMSTAFAAAVVFPLTRITMFFLHR
jgi:uncharacterized protein (TIGR00297 family)